MKMPPHSLAIKRYKFHKETLVESIEELHNPGRGWYTIYYFRAEERFDREKYRYREDSGESLALVFIDIGAFRDDRISGEALANIDGILGFFTEIKKDIILRVAYDHAGAAQEREPFFFSYVTDHIVQLSELIIKYAPHIYVFQGMLVGNWGEMHASKFLTNIKIRKLASLLSKCVGQDSFLAVRRPVHWRIINPEAEGVEDFSKTRIGLFDDAIMGSETHLGTFAEAGCGGGWMEPWTKEEELGFESKLCRYAPNGGEAVYDESRAAGMTLDDVIDRFKAMNISYLNSAYDERFMGMLKDMSWKGGDAWAGVSGYDYIGRHMGYRFCIRGVSMKCSGGKNPVCTWKVDIENTGFARCYYEADAYIACVGADNEAQESMLDIALDSIMPGEAATGSARMIPVSGDVYLYAERRKDKAPICFANATKHNRKIFLGRLSLL